MGVCEQFGLQVGELFEVLHPVRFVFLSYLNSEGSRIKDSPGDSLAAKLEVRGRSVQPMLLLRDLDLLRQRI